MLILQTALLLSAPQLVTGPVPVTDPSTLAADGFGTAIAIEGDLAVVGSREDIGNASAAYGPGAVSVFRRVGDAWLFEDRLAAPAGALRDQFGAAVDITVVAGRTMIAVGAPGRGSASGGSPGAAYVFERVGAGSWQFAARFDGDPMRTSFGDAVAIEGTTLTVGQPDFAGGVFLFERSGAGTWSPNGELNKPITIFDSAEFGASLAMEGPLLVVGAPGEDAMSYDSGAAYVYRNDAGPGYIEQARLEHPSAATVTGHGVAVAVSTDLPNERVVVGSHDGKAFVWVHIGSGWVTEVVLLPFDGETDSFGEAVAIQGGRMAVGAPRRLGLSSSSGAVLEWKYDGVNGDWEPGALLHPTTLDGAQFGASVALASDATNGDSLLVGAPRADLTGLDAGAVRSFDLSLRLGAAHCAGRRNSIGASASLTVHGSTAAADANLGIDVVGLPPTSAGYLLSARDRAQIPALGGGDGDLCLGGTISRVQSALAIANAAGTISVTLDFQALPPSATWNAGSTWSFQWWYRDQATQPTSNTSQGIELRFD